MGVTTDMDTVWDTVDTMVDTTVTLTDTDIIWARGPLMPNLRLMLMPLLMPTMDTTAVDTDTVWDTTAMDTDTDIPVLMVTTDTTLARGLLMPNLKLMLMPLLMPTTDTTAVDTDTDMAVTTAMVDILMDTDTDTTTASRFLL